MYKSCEKLSNLGMATRLISLARIWFYDYCPCVKLILLIPFFTISLFLASCSKEKVVNVTEVRESIGTGDELFVYTEMVPDGWRMVGSVGSAFTRPVASYAVGEKSLPNPKP